MGGGNRRHIDTNRVGKQDVAPLAAVIRSHSPLVISMRVSSLLSLSLVFALGVASTDALAKRVEVTNVTASSEYPADDTGSYDAKKVADNKVATAWVEGEDRNGLGAWVKLELGGEKEVAKLTFFAGMWYSVKYWDYSSRPTQVELEFSDGSTELVTIPDEMKAYEHTLKKPVKTSSVKVTLRNVQSGSTFSDTGISDIVIEDTSPSAMAKIVKVEASSTAPSDADGSYDPRALYDGMKDTMWCEGNKSSDGSGETLTYTFASKRTIDTLHLNNGIGTSLPFFMKGNRAQNVTLTFGDGSTHKQKVANTMLPKTYSFPPVTTDTVTITFDDAVKGKEFDDLCISEAYFSGK